MFGSFLAEAVLETMDKFFSLGTGTKMAIFIVGAGIFLFGTGQFMSGVSNVIIAAKTKELTLEESQQEESPETEEKEKQE